MRGVKDKRAGLWARLEKRIQRRAGRKDRNFILAGKWKKFIRKQDEFKIYSVDVEWVKTNLNVTFGHGGHGYVFEFIPLNEVWIGTHHFKRCGCRNAVSGQKVSRKYLESTVIHEMAEFRNMKEGMSFWRAHQIALQKERESGILEEPHTEVKQ